MLIVYMHHADRDLSKGQNQDNPITEHEKREADAIGDIFGTRKFPVTCIYTGDYVRYHQTNELINKHLQVPIYNDSRLNEIDCTGKEYEKRIHNFIHDIIVKHNNDEIVICMTSGVALTCFMSYFMKEPIKGFSYAQGTTVSPVNFCYDKDYIKPFINEWKQ